MSNIVRRSSIILMLFVAIALFAPVASAQRATITNPTALSDTVYNISRVVVFSSSTTLTGPVYAYNITIDSGVTVTTNDNPLIAYDYLNNGGTIVGGSYGSSATSSYGGSGGGGGGNGGGGGAEGQNGYATQVAGGTGGTGYTGSAQNGGTGSTPSAPSLSASTIQTWYSNGLYNYLTGAAGGNGGAGDTGFYGHSGPGSYGVYIQGYTVTAGSINVNGANGGSMTGAPGGGAGGGGGGYIIVSYGNGGYTSGSYSYSAGSGGTGSLENGTEGVAGGNGGAGGMQAFSQEALPTATPATVPTLTIATNPVTKGTSDVVSASGTSTDTIAIEYSNGTVIASGTGSASFNADTFNTGSYTLEACDTSVDICSATQTLTVNPPTVTLSIQYNPAIFRQNDTITGTTSDSGDTIQLKIAGSVVSQGTGTTSYNGGSLSAGTYQVQACDISTTTADCAANQTLTIDPLPSGVLEYVPFSINNTQSTATAAPFVQTIVVNMSKYTAYLAGNLQNVEWAYANGTIITSRLQYGTNNTNAAYILKLPNGIAANSKISVYMDLVAPTTNLFNGGTVGEAPQLSSTYGEYDNGPNLYSFYYNFAGTTLNTSKFTVSGTDYSVNDGISITGASSATYIQSASEYNPQTEVIDVYSYVTALNNNGDYYQGYAQSGAGLPQYLLSDVGGASSQYTLANHNSAGQTNADITGGSTIAYQIWSVWSSTTESYATLNYSSATTLSTDFTAETAAYILFYQTSANTQHTYWVGVRPAPPNGVMPTATAGPLTKVPTLTLSIQNINPQYGQSDTITVTAPESNQTVALVIAGTTVATGTGSLNYNLLNTATSKYAYAVGTYQVQGQDTSSSTVTANQTITIAQAKPVLAFTTTCTNTTYSGSSCTTTGKAYVNVTGFGAAIPVNLYVNTGSVGSTTLTNTTAKTLSTSLAAAGTYTITLNNTATQNYTTNKVSYVYKIAQATPTVSLSISPTANFTYNGTNIAASYSISSYNNQLTGTLYINKVSTATTTTSGTYTQSGAANTYTFIFNTTGNTNYTTATTASHVIKISQASTSAGLTVDGSTTPPSQYTGKAEPINATSITDYNNQLTWTIYYIPPGGTATVFNTTTIDKSFSFTGQLNGVYTFYISTAGNQNYTSYKSANITQNFISTKVTIVPTSYFDLYGSNDTITAQTTKSTDTVALYIDGHKVASGTGSVTYNLANYTTAGVLSLFANDTTNSTFLPAKAKVAYINPPQQVGSYVPFNLTSMPAAPYTQLITANSLAYEKYEATGLTNVAAFTANGTVLTGTILRNATNTATSTQYGIKIPVANNQTSIIFLGFAYTNSSTYSNPAFNMSVNTTAPLPTGSQATQTTGSLYAIPAPTLSIKYNPDILGAYNPITATLTSKYYSLNYTVFLNGKLYSSQNGQQKVVYNGANLPLGNITIKAINLHTLQASTLSNIAILPVLLHGQQIALNATYQSALNPYTTSNSVAGILLEFYNLTSAKVTTAIQSIKGSLNLTGTIASGVPSKPITITGYTLGFNDTSAGFNSNSMYQIDKVCATTNESQLLSAPTGTLIYTTSANVIQYYTLQATSFYCNAAAQPIQLWTITNTTNLGSFEFYTLSGVTQVQAQAQIFYYNPNLDAYDLIDYLTTPSQGGIIADLPNNEQYEINLYQNGKLLTSFTTSLSCPTGAICSEPLQIQQKGITQFNATTNIAYNCAYTNTSHSFACSVTDPTSTALGYKLQVSQQGAAGSTIVCTNNLTGSYGTLSCGGINATAALYGYNLYVNYANNQTYLVAAGTVTNQPTTTNFGTTGIIAAILLLLALSLIAFYNPLATIIGDIIALVIIGMLGLAVVGAAVLAQFIIVAVIYIYKMRQ